MNEVTLLARLPRPPVASHISPASWQLITDVIWPAAKDPLVIVTAWNYCMARKLDPMKRPVHIVPVYSKAAKKMIETIWPGIGELQTTAARSGIWAGMDAPEWGPDIKRTFKGHVDATEWGPARDIEETVTYPAWGIVKVYRLVRNERVGFAEQVYWDEAYARQGFRSEVPNEMWSKRPRGQLAKVCKAASLRAAFPEDIGGDYSADEMEGQTIEGTMPLDSTPSPQSRSAPADRHLKRDLAIQANPAAQTEARQTQDPKEPISNDYVPPEYKIVMPDGTLFESGTGTEYIEDWRKGIERLATKPELLKSSRDDNREQIAKVGEFDPNAASRVATMLAEALGETNNEHDAA